MKIMTSNKKKYISIISALLIMLCLTTTSHALVIRGFFPVSQGNFWNFSQPTGGLVSSWAINGTMHLNGVGKVFCMIQENGYVLLMREDWEGLQIYAEYRPDGIYKPEKPFLFLPRVISPDPQAPPVTARADFSVLTGPDNMESFTATGKEQRTVSFRMLGFENLTVHKKEYIDCIVIEKTTIDSSGKTLEQLWLAPNIGPIKRVVQKGKTKTTYIVSSYAGMEPENDRSFSVQDLFPLTPGIKRIYKDKQGNNETTEMQEPINARLEDRMVTPYVDHIKDVQYLAYSERGLVMVQRYWAGYGGLTICPPPEKPVVVLPPEIKLGAYNISNSYPRSFNPRSMTMFEITHPQMIFSSMALDTEDLTVPAGSFKDCVKVSIVYKMMIPVLQADILRLGYVWLKAGKGIVKEELINIRSIALPQAEDAIFDVRSWELAKIEINKEITSRYNTPSSRTANTKAHKEEQKKDAPEIENIKTTSVPVKKGDSKGENAKKISWQDNSKAMYDKVISETPVMFRWMAKKKLEEAVVAQAGSDGLITENMVIVAFKEVTPARFVKSTLANIELLKTR
jgi:hypothetical protein